MDNTQDRLNCIKNLLLLMCCDRKIEKKEQEFLYRTANALGLLVEDLNLLVEQVKKEENEFYPIENKEMAVAALKSLIIMTKSDKKVDDNEKEFILRFSKSIGLSGDELKHMVLDIDMESLYKPFQKSSLESILVITTDFENIDKFIEIAEKNGLSSQTAAYGEFIRGEAGEADIVCIHAAADKKKTLNRCRNLLEKPVAKIIPILSRFQGHQVKYLHEIGLTKCIIEPVYDADIDKIISK